MASGGQCVISVWPVCGQCVVSGGQCRLVCGQCIVGKLTVLVVIKWSVGGLWWSVSGQVHGL